MRIKDNGLLIGKIKAGELETVCLDIGCGPLKLGSDWIGIDALAYDGVDLVGDVFDILKELPEGSVDKVYSSHFFEHFQEIERLLDEMTRVMKVGGIISIIVPHFSNAYFYSDYTHRSFFGLYTFSYLAEDKLFTRKVPDYNRNRSLSIERVKLNFKSPFFVRDKILKVIGWVFNISIYMKELYEEIFSRIIPCYELHFELKKK